MNFARLHSYQKEAIRSTLVDVCAAVAAVHARAVKDLDGMSQSISLVPLPTGAQDPDPAQGFIAKARIDAPTEKNTDDIITVFEFYSMRKRVAVDLSSALGYKTITGEDDVLNPRFIHVSCQE